MSSNGIQGVRGNQDQKVIEWRGWITWILSRPGGAEFLRTARDSWEKAKKKGDTLKSWNKQQHRAAEKASGSLSDEEALMDKATAKWWHYVPSDWTLFSDPYMIASEMTEMHYEYLISLPVRIHVPHAHLFLVHAGLLSHNPKYDYDDPGQPLGHVPTTSRIYAYGDRITALRRALNPLTGWMARLVLQTKDSYRGDVAEDIVREQQERAVLDLPLNRDPWVSMNLRSVRHGKPSRCVCILLSSFIGILTHVNNVRGNKGTPWSEIWNADMDMCHGFDTRDAVDPSTGVMKKHRKLPCLPMSVIYGHAAARRLDIKRWSFGLDTGCVSSVTCSSLTCWITEIAQAKKRQLTALVHGGTHDDGDKLIAFGDASQARIVSVKCKS